MTSGGSSFSGKVLLVQPRTPGPAEWLSMTRYTAGVAQALRPDIDVSLAEATHLNLSRPFRRFFQRYRELEPLPRRWPHPADVVHFTDAYVGVHMDRFPGAKLATVHDLITLDYATKLRPGIAYWRYSFVTSLKAMRRMDGVITPSEATRQELIRRTPIAPERIHAVPVLVPDDIAPPATPIEREAATILSIGTGSGYKNMPVLLHALAAPELRGARLIRVGRPLWPTDQALLGELGIADRVEQRRYVTDEELLQLYHTSTLLAQPSLTEGFGMPVAEAMCAGLPVVTSNGGALPEVVGDGGRIVPFRKLAPGPVDLDDARDFARAMAEVLEDAGQRDAMRAAGLREAPRFRIPAVREGLVAAYAAAMEVAGNAERPGSR